MADFELVKVKGVTPHLEASDCRLPIDRDLPSIIIPRFSDTEIKLAECQFFLNMIEQNGSHQAVMYFCLSAFLAAARSVTLFLQAEGCKCAGFSEWYEGAKKQLKDDEVALFLKSSRDKALHARYATVKTVFDIPLYKTQEGWVHKPGEDIHVGFSFPKYLFENGLRKCHGFVELLRDIVEDAKDRGFLRDENRRNVTLEFRDFGRDRQFAPIIVEQADASNSASQHR